MCLLMYLYLNVHFIDLINQFLIEFRCVSDIYLFYNDNLLSVIHIDKCIFENKKNAHMVTIFVQSILFNTFY